MIEPFTQGQFLQGLRPSNPVNWLVEKFAKLERFELAWLGYTTKTEVAPCVEGKNLDFRQSIAHSQQRPR